jgi:hypothetical protein
MKQCPTCNRTYTDETLTFCLADGTLLSPLYDPEATQIISPPPNTNPSSTVISSQQSAQPLVVRQGVNPSVVYVLVVLLAMLVAGGAVVLLYERSKKDAPTSSTRQIDSEVTSATPIQGNTAPKVQPKIQPNDEGIQRRENTYNSLPGKYPEGSTRLLTSNDIAGKSAWELKIMRNEIYARHGYIFKDPELSSYFESQSWYRPIYQDVTYMISSIEKENAAFIKRYE